MFVNCTCEQLFVASCIVCYVVASATQDAMVHVLKLYSKFAYIQSIWGAAAHEQEIIYTLTNTCT